MLHIFLTVILRPFIMFVLFVAAVFGAYYLYPLIPEGRIKALLYRRHWFGDRDPTMFIAWIVAGVVLYSWFWFLNGRHF